MAGNNSTPHVAHLHVPAQWGKPAMELGLTAGLNMIGKSKGEVRLDHDFVSSIHAFIEISDDLSEIWLQDLESTNGTFFGDSVVSLRPKRFYELRSGRKLRFGRTYATFELVDPSAGVVDDDLMNRTFDKTAILPGVAAIDDAAVSDTSMQSHNEGNLHALNQELAESDEQDLFQDAAEGPVNDSDHEEAAVQKSRVDALDAVLDMAKEIADFSDTVGSPAIVQEDGVPGSPCFPSGKDLMVESNYSNSDFMVADSLNGPGVKSTMPSQELCTEQPPEKENIGVSVPDSPPIATIKSPAISSRAQSPIQESVAASPETVQESSKAASPVKKQPVKVKLGRAKRTIAKKTSPPEIINLEIPKDDIISIADTKSSTSGRRKRNADREPPVSAKASKKIKDKENIEDSSEIIVVFTGVNEPEPKKRLLEKYGVKVVDSWESCTHLVTDKIKRTTKFLAALSSGKQIISSDWIKQCQKQKKLVDISEYPLVDKASEKKWAFKLQDSVDRVKERGPSSLFADLTFLITPSIQPAYYELEEMIVAGGGKVVSNLPVRHEDSCFIIGCAEDKSLIQGYQKSGWKEQILDAEFVMSGSLKQELDFHGHRYSGKRRA